MDLATITLSTLMLGSCIADTETTLHRPAYTREGNPFMAPFADSHVELYSVKGALNLGVGVASYKLRKSHSKPRRIVGWALPALSIVTQSLAARHNARLR